MATYRRESNTDAKYEDDGLLLAAMSACSASDSSRPVKPTTSTSSASASASSGSSSTNMAESGGGLFNSAFSRNKSSRASLLFSSGGATRNKSQSRIDDPFLCAEEAEESPAAWASLAFRRSRGTKNSSTEAQEMGDGPSTNQEDIRGEDNTTSEDCEIDYCLRCCGPRAMQNCSVSIQYGNFMTSEVLNAITHGLGVLIIPFLAQRLYTKFQGGDADSMLNCPNAALSLGTFLFCGALMFLCSATYHSLFYVVSVVKAMQILDHSGIYLLISGTYYPIITIGCKDLNYSAAAGSAGLDDDTRSFNYGPMILTACYGLLTFIGFAISVACSHKRWYAHFIVLAYLVMGFAGAPYIFSQCFGDELGTTSSTSSNTSQAGEAARAGAQLQLGSTTGRTTSPSRSRNAKIEGEQQSSAVHLSHSTDTPSSTSPPCSTATAFLATHAGESRGTQEAAQEQGVLSNAAAQSNNKNSTASNPPNTSSTATRRQQNNTTRKQQHSQLSPDQSKNTRKVEELEKKIRSDFWWAKALIIAGGAGYVAGVYFFLQRHLPFFHVIWHLFVLAAFCLHYKAVDATVDAALAKREYFSFLSRL
ncbi:unnamed protein product [Amoebophrya sp. A25]|nr:unnamed protein product [Amoebophrya sp. A25]|eukprot:GSA25T00024949001.1